MKKLMILLALITTQAWSQTADTTVTKKAEPVVKKAKTEAVKDTTKAVTKAVAPVVKDVKKEVIVKDTVKAVAKPVMPVTKEVKKEDVKTDSTKKVEKVEIPNSLKTTMVDDSTKTDSVKVIAKPEPQKIVVKEISMDEKKRLIEKNLKAKEIQAQILNRKIEAITAAYMTDAEGALKDLKKNIRQETQYLTDIEKIKKSTFLTERIKKKKIAYTNNKLRKVLVRKDDLIDDLEKIAFIHFTNIIAKRTSYVNSLKGTDQIIEKMNIRLELMKIGKSILSVTKQELTESYNITVVDQLITKMEKNFIKKYESLIATYK